MCQYICIYVYAPTSTAYINIGTQVQENNIIYLFHTSDSSLSLHCLNRVDIISVFDVLRVSLYTINVII